MKKNLLSLSLAIIINHCATAFTSCPNGIAICNDGYVSEFEQRLAYGLSEQGIITCKPDPETDIESLCEDHDGTQNVLAGKRAILKNIFGNYNIIPNAELINAAGNNINEIIEKTTKNFTGKYLHKIPGISYVKRWLPEYITSAMDQRNEQEALAQKIANAENLSNLRKQENIDGFMDKDGDIFFDTNTGTDTDPVKDDQKFVNLNKPSLAQNFINFLESDE